MPRPKTDTPKPPTDWKKALKKLADALDKKSDYCLQMDCPAADICDQDRNSDENRCRRCIVKWARSL